MQTREQNVDLNSFARRHIGPSEAEVAEMLSEVGFENLDSLIDAAVPKNIRLDRQLKLPEAKSETDALAELRAISRKNKVARSFIGAGYYDCVTPPFQIGKRFLSQIIVTRKQSLSFKHARNHSALRSRSAITRVFNSTTRFSAHSFSIPPPMARFTITPNSLRECMTRVRLLSSQRIF